MIKIQCNVRNENGEYTYCNSEMIHIDRIRDFTYTVDAVNGEACLTITTIDGDTFRYMSTTFDDLTEVEIISDLLATKRIIYHIPTVTDNKTLAQYRTTLNEIINQIFCLVR